MCEVLGMETRVFKISSYMTFDIIAFVSCPKSYPPSQQGGIVQGLHHATGAQGEWVQPEVPTAVLDPVIAGKFTVRPIKNDGWSFFFHFGEHFPFSGASCSTSGVYIIKMRPHPPGVGNLEFPYGMTQK